MSQLYTKFKCQPSHEDIGVSIDIAFDIIIIKFFESSSVVFDPYQLKPTANRSICISSSIQLHCNSTGNVWHLVLIHLRSLTHFLQSKHTLLHAQQLQENVAICTDRGVPSWYRFHCESLLSVIF